MMEDAFILLSKNGVNRHQITECLTSLHENYNKQYNNKIVIFHEDGFNDDIDFINGLNVPNILYHKVTLQEPEEFLNESYDVKWPRAENSKYWSLKYSNMCSFFAHEVFQHCLDIGIKTYCRLDTDSIITGKINYNIFDDLNRRDLIYGYIIEQREFFHVVLELNNFIGEYIKEHDIKPTFYNKLLDQFGYYNYRCFYNNFELLNIEKFYTPEVKQFLSAIKQSKNIYHYRWGDAPIRTMLFSLFFEEHRIKKYVDIDYTHLPFQHKNGNCNMTFNFLGILGRL